jgi:hypothetical protein
MSTQLSGQFTYDFIASPMEHNANDQAVDLGEDFSSSQWAAEGVITVGTDSWSFSSIVGLNAVDPFLPVVPDSGNGGSFTGMYAYLGGAVDPATSVAIQNSVSFSIGLPQPGGVDTVDVTYSVDLTKVV